MLKNYYKNIIKYDLINKFNYQNVKEIPELKKIILNFGCKNSELKNISSSLLTLELIAAQSGFITQSNKINIILKIRKGQPVGCAVVLKKDKMYDFFLILLTEIFPNLKDFKDFKAAKTLDKFSFSFTLKSLINFRHLEKHFYLFENLPPLNITIVTSAQTREELLYLLNSFKLKIN